MFRCAIMGVSGSRARGLANAYRLISRGRLVAVSTRQTENLRKFADDYGVEKRYADYQVMFDKERPDLVHVNTPPDVRVEVLEAAAECGVKAVVFEKPIALEAEDYHQLVALSQHVTTKVAVNHQLHFHPNREYPQERVAAGAIGKVEFIDASCQLTLVHQGTHMLQAIGAFNQGGKPMSVFGEISGADKLAPNPRAHYSPDNCVAAIEYDNGVRAQLTCGEVAPSTATGTSVSHHKRVRVYGDRGRAVWSMWDWELVNSGGRVESGKHDYGEQDIQGQAGLVNAMFDWLEDEGKVHPLNLESALVDFNTLLGIYTSGLLRKPIALPCAPPNRLIERMRRCLSQTE